MLIEIESLPEKCSCGSTTGTTIRCSIQSPDGMLLKEIACEGCGKRLLIPDKIAEESRKLLGEKYRPTWFYEPETGEIIHWAHATDRDGE